MHKLLTENLTYPEQAKKDSIQGKVYVSFTILTDGTISNVKAERKVHPLLDAEAVRLVKLTDKKWVPALINDKPAESEYQILINFRLDNKQINNAQITEFLIRTPETITQTSGSITQTSGSITQTSVIIKGKVTDKDTKEALANVNVVEVDKNGRFITGTVTDLNGTYTLKVRDTSNSIQASFKSYNESTVTVDGRTTINIELERER